MDYIYFGGNVPLVITGEITNLENDMIEITTFPEEEIIYIDFAYKGLPEELQIEKILIRTSPEQQKFDDEVTQDQAVKEDQLNSQLVDKQKYDPTIQFESVQGVIY